MSRSKTALTLEQIQEIRRRRAAGERICDLAEEYHVVRETIHHYLKQPYGDPVIAPVKINCAYPGLKAWLVKKGWRGSDLAYAIGYKPGSLDNILSGLYPPSKRVIDRVLKVTGLTYEVAWKMEEADENLQ